MKEFFYHKLARQNGGIAFRLWSKMGFSPPRGRSIRFVVDSQLTKPSKFGMLPITLPPGSELLARFLTKFSAFIRVYSVIACAFSDGTNAHFPCA